MGGAKVTPELGGNTACGKAKSASPLGIAVGPGKSTSRPQIAVRNYLRDMTFWDRFEDACEVAAEALGEPLSVGGVALTGMPYLMDGAAPGGRRFLPSGEIVVPPTWCHPTACAARCAATGAAWSSRDRLGADGRWPAAPRPAEPLERHSAWDLSAFIRRTQKMLSHRQLAA